MVDEKAWKEIASLLKSKDVHLVAVSKTKPVTDVLALYELGQRSFGENYVQELADKEPQLPKDIEWHFIGHLQTNKVKMIAPFVALIHSVDSLKLLQEIEKQGAKNNRVIYVLLQQYIASEETKYGLDKEEIKAIAALVSNTRDQFAHVQICGLMGMASNTDNTATVIAEFEQLHQLFHELKQTYFSDQETFATCSMGMSGDYKIAIEHGANMVRIGSLLFGAR